MGIETISILSVTHQQQKQWLVHFNIRFFLLNDLIASEGLKKRIVLVGSRPAQTASAWPSIFLQRSNQISQAKTEN